MLCVPLSEAEADDSSAQVIEGLSYMHTNDWLHRDVRSIGPERPATPIKTVIDGASSFTSCELTLARSRPPTASST